MQAEKGDHPRAVTSSELCRLLGIAPITLRRKLKNGTFPEPAHRTDNGWRLWDPDQVTEMIRTMRGIRG